MTRPARLILSVVLGAACLLLVPAAAHAADTVTVDGQSRVLTATNAARTANTLIRYTPAFGASTGTNAYGFEAAVVADKITRIENGVGNMAIPSGGYVLSGHGDARTWLRAVASVGATVSVGAEPPPPPPPPASWVVIGELSRALTGTDVVRTSNALVRYTPARGATTGTNAYGFEAAVVNDKVTRAEDGIGNMAVPTGGYVLSGHGEARSWLRANAVVGATVNLRASPPPAEVAQLLPDVGVRTLRRFSIQYSGSAKLLKFPAVTANIGNGPMEIRAVRSSSTSDDWVGRQVVHNTDASTTTLPASGADFYWAGDGHAHWHIRDFDSYELFNSSGTQVQVGEKHGFCFEDNTQYRDWVGHPNRPQVPTSPVYTHEGSCGEAQPAATSIVHGLSVGWGDTYPDTLPDQAIDITGLPDGTYLVKVTADWQHYWRETNESNNSASAQIRITGNTVTLISAADGL